MPHQLIRASLRLAALVLAVIAAFAAAGGAAGWLWHRLWDAPPGVVAGGEWYPSPPEQGLRADFDGTGAYVLLAFIVGLLVGAVVALATRRHEVVVLSAVLVGAALGGWVMAAVGSRLGPPDPHLLARVADDGTRLPGHLHVTGWTPYLALPAGALLALLAVYLLTPRVGQSASGAWEPK